MRSRNFWRLVALALAAGSVLPATALARISHSPPTADADPSAVARAAPSAGLNVVSTTPSTVFSPRHAPQRRLGALATDGREKRGLAQNRVINGAFEQSLAGWTTDAGDGRSAAWNSDDADASPASGSVEIRHAGTATGFPVMVLGQCVSLSGMPAGSTPFGVRSKALQESAGIVQAHVSLTFYRDFVCSDFLSPGPNYALALNNPNWIDEDASFNRNADAHSVLIELGISKNLGGGSSGAARFDDLYVGAPGAGPAPVELGRWTVDSGGGRASGGTVVLGGSIGQPDAGSAAGATIELQGGFWFAAGDGPDESIFRNGFESP